MRWLSLVLCLIAGSAAAVEPAEMLADPVLERRARDISHELRCLVCRNESIDESHADLARDLRLLVRERLLAGDSDQDVIGFIVERYGEFVLLKPNSSGANLILWWAGPAGLLIAGMIAALYIRRRRRAETTPDELSDEENERLTRLLDGG